MCASFRACGWMHICAGEMRDWWDRTEAQQRGALHSHILCWFKPRVLKPEYKALRAITRTAKGTDSKQRPKEQVVRPLHDYQEDPVCTYALLASTPVSCCISTLTRTTFTTHITWAASGVKWRAHTSKERGDGVASTGFPCAWPAWCEACRADSTFIRALPGTAC